MPLALIASTILISSTISFILCVPTALLLGIPLDPICLSEALPFLVITVGFEKPLKLARAVFSNPSVFLPATGGTKPSAVRSRNNMDVKTAKDVVLEAVEEVGPGIVRDYAIEVLVLGIGAASGVGGLREFCALAALLLFVDCVSVLSFYVGVLTVMVEVRVLHFSYISDSQHLFAQVKRIKVKRAANKAAKSGTSTPEKRQPSRTTPASSLHRTLSRVLGEKVEHGQENPLIRLKLLLVRRASSSTASACSNPSHHLARFIPNSSRP
jgi:hydroxymethylglutaryl-CoA reductase (NADPH)